MKSETQSKLIISTKALVSVVPWIGGAINSVWNDISLESYKKRMNEFFININEEIESIKENLDLEKINSEDFQDIFDNTLNLVIRNRHEKKREAFRKILINSMAVNTIDFDKTEAFIKLIDQLPLMHLIILEDLKNHKVEGRDPNSGKRIFNKQKEKFNLDEDNLYEIIKDLENNYLVSVYSKHYQNQGQPLGSYYSGAKNYLTGKGEELLELVN